VNTIYYLAYASTAARPFTELELLALLAQSRDANARLDVTGMLLYAPAPGGPGSFVQVLEGPRASVQALYVKIIRDTRHRECVVLEEGTLFQRRFAEWTMGFKNLATVKPADVPGFSPVFLQNWTMAKIVAERDPVLRFLYSFAGE
jgi:hypothetical protein